MASLVEASAKSPSHAKFSSHGDDFDHSQNAMSCTLEKDDADVLSCEDFRFESLHKVINVE